MGRRRQNKFDDLPRFHRKGKVWYHVSDTGERIRDKIAASKAKGMWMGGTPPLG